MSDHVRYLSYIYIAFGVLGLMFAGFLFLVLRGGAILAADPGAGFALSTAATLIGLFFAILSLPSIILGYGLLNKKRWAIPMGYIVGAISLFHFPIGTAVGIYTFWVLLQDQARRILRR